MKDYYYILGIDKSASIEEIKTAHRSLSKKFHPDLNPNDSHSEGMFKDIQEAYDCLSDKNKRMKYDKDYFAWANGKQQNSPPPVSNKKPITFKEAFNHFIALIGLWAMIIFWPVSKAEDAHSLSYVIFMDIGDLISGKLQGDLSIVIIHIIEVNYVILSLFILTIIYLLKLLKNLKTGLAFIIFAWLISLSNITWFVIFWYYFNSKVNFSYSMYLIPIVFMLFSIALPGKNEKLRTALEELK